jgi:hypothetical protein
MISTREVTWGEALWLELKKAPGGLKATHQDILKLTGKHMGVRNTFSKLPGNRVLGVLVMNRSGVRMTVVGKGGVKAVLPVGFPVAIEAISGGSRSHRRSKK